MSSSARVSGEARVGGEAWVYGEAVVGAAGSLFYLLRRQRAPLARLMPAASLVAMAVAGTWFCERVFDLRLIS